MVSNTHSSLAEAIGGLARRKRRFAAITSVTFLAFFTALPVLASSTSVLEVRAFGDISWAYVYAASLFPIGWALSLFYMFISRRTDASVDQIVGSHDLNMTDRFQSGGAVK